MKEKEKEKREIRIRNGRSPGILALKEGVFFPTETQIEMDSSPPCGPWKPCLHHHHHHHHHLFLCPLPLPHHHHHHHHHHHLHISPQCPHHSYLLQPNSHSLASPIFLPLPNQSNLQVSGLRQTYPPSDAPMMREEEGYEEGVVEEDEDEDEDEEDPVFVLTDEWKEFFAKSEAKRKLAKKQARKKGKV
ncbi:unnamed protein product [Camellia sinensis]